MSPLRLGTRGSALARRQASQVAETLAALGTPVELVVIRTSGDALRGSLAAAGGKGLFVREIEEDLLAGRIDCAVHSLKDLPAALPDGLALVATPPREDARDVLVAASARTLRELPSGTRIGTGSLRRRAQLLADRADLLVRDMRGNVDTRLRKLAAGEVDALVLAAAGLRRLGLARPDATPLAPEAFVPAIGQGVLALEARAADERVRALLAPLDDAATAAAVAAERAFLAAIGGDCRTPLAAHATLVADRTGRPQAMVRLDALVAELDGSTMLREREDAPVAAAAALGARLAERLLARGAAAIIARAHARGAEPA